MLEIILLSITQGITEFLPISSSAHLILASKILGFNNNNLILDVSLHFGSLLAVIFYFKKEILNFVKNKYLFSKVIIGSLPTMIFGYFLIKLGLIEKLRNEYLIGLTTILFGILLYFADNTRQEKNIDNNFSLKNAIYIGLFQILSLIPGVSRAGITITAARFFKFSRIDSAKISFMLSIPTLFAASFYNIFKILELKNLELTYQNLLAIFLSFTFSLITLKLFINFLKRFSLNLFAFYRIILGLLLFYFLNL